MPVVVSLEDFRPSPRYDGEPWTDAQIYEGTASDAVFTLLETQALTPVDADPENPAYRNFTTQLGTAEELWYQIVFIDADMSTGQPTAPVQNVPDERPVYASVSQLANRLRVSATQRHDDLMRVLKSAADEIDHEIGTVDINGTSLPYSNPPAIVRQVNIERSVEHWKQEQSPMGIIGLGDEMAMYTARDSWDRHKHKLYLLKADFPDRMSVATIMDALADQIGDQLCGTANPVIENLQVENRLHPNPTPPCIDIFPSTPFTEAIGYGSTRQYWFNVRARVSTGDHEAGQDLLLAMMDNETDESVEAAVRSVRSYAGAQLGDVEGPTEFGVFRDQGGEESLLGCTWRVALIP